MAHPNSISSNHRKCDMTIEKNKPEFFGVSKPTGFDGTVSIVSLVDSGICLVFVIFVFFSVCDFSRPKLDPSDWVTVCVCECIGGCFMSESGKREKAKKINKMEISLAPDSASGLVLY